MMMPRMGGYPVLEHFKGKTDAPPIIMITANEGSRHKAYAEYLGVVDYIRKPFAMERLLEAVQQGAAARGRAPTAAERMATSGRRREIALSTSARRSSCWSRAPRSQPVDSRLVPATLPGPAGMPPGSAAPARKQSARHVVARQAVRLQLSGDAVAPAGGNLVHRRLGRSRACSTAPGTAASASASGQKSAGKGTCSPRRAARAFMAAFCSASFLFAPQAAG